MNYYERHLGDYAKDTAHLTMIEHGAYGLLLDRYYATEQGIPADQAHRVARARTKEEKAAVDTVLEEFFLLIDGAWINNRTEEEITKAQSKIKAAQENGKRGGRPKKNQEETQEKPTGFPVGYENETEQKAHQPPTTNHQLDNPDGLSRSCESKNSPPSKIQSRFEEFWSAYPKKVGKKPAADRWKSKKLDSIADQILADIPVRLAKDRKWIEDGGKYIPNPETYLNQERWNDEIEPMRSNMQTKINGSDLGERNRVVAREAAERYRNQQTRIAGGQS